MVQPVTHSLNQWTSNPAPTLGLRCSGLINMPRALKCDTTDYLDLYIDLDYECMASES